MSQNRRIPTDRVLEKLDDLLKNNRYADAKNHLLYWLAEAEAESDDNALLLLYNELMGLTRKLGEQEQSLHFAHSALRQIEKMNIDTNVGAATTYLNCATVYKAFGRADQAVPLFEKAKTIYKASLPPTDDRWAGLYNNMALALVDLKRFEQAEALYRDALTVLRQNPNKEPEQAITYLNMATAAEMRYGAEAADSIIADYLQRAMELLDRCRHQTDGNYAFVCEKCASVFGYYGYFSYENELKTRYRRIYEGA